MKRLIASAIAAGLLFCGGYADEHTVTSTTIVYVNVFSNRLTFPEAEVTYGTNGLVTVKASNGWTYTTHSANVVVVTMPSGTSAPRRR